MLGAEELFVTLKTNSTLNHHNDFENSYWQHTSHFWACLLAGDALFFFLYIPVDKLPKVDSLISWQDYFWHSLSAVW